MRTNINVKGKHGMLNRHAKRGNSSLYLMVRLLDEQVQLVDCQHGISFGVRREAEKRQRKLYRLVQAEILAN